MTKHNFWVFYYYYWRTLTVMALCRNPFVNLHKKNVSFILHKLRKSHLFDELDVIFSFLSLILSSKINKMYECKKIWKLLHCVSVWIFFPFQLFLKKILFVFTARHYFLCLPIRMESIWKFDVYRCWKKYFYCFAFVYKTLKPSKIFL